MGTGLGSLVLTAALLGEGASFAGGSGRREAPRPGTPGVPGAVPGEVDAPKPSLVLFAGYGWPEEWFDYAYRDILDFLRSQGVVLRKDPEDNEPDRMNANAFEFFRRNLRGVGVDSILYMRLDLGERQVDRLVLRCFDENGDLMWEEAASGVMSMSYAGSVRALLKRMKKKLRAHIGEAGLPVRKPEAEEKEGGKK